MKHSDYVKIISDLATKSLKEALIKGVIKNAPFFAFGLWNPLLVKVATYLAEWASREAELQIFYKYIDFRTDVQAKDFEKAMLHNHTMQLIGSKEEKDESERLLKNALIKLVALKS